MDFVRSYFGTNKPLTSWTLFSSLYDWFAVHTKQMCSLIFTFSRIVWNQDQINHIRPRKFLISNPIVSWFFFSFCDTFSVKSTKNVGNARAKRRSAYFCLLNETSRTSRILICFECLSMFLQSFPICFVDPDFSTILVAKVYVT